MMTMDIFKAFGLRKAKSLRHAIDSGTDTASQNLGGGAVLPSSEEPEDQHPDKNKKETPGGPDLETDIETGDISVAEDDDEGGNGE